MIINEAFSSFARRGEAVHFKGIRENEHGSLLIIESLEISCKGISARANTW